MKSQTSKIFLKLDFLVETFQSRKASYVQANLWPNVNRAFDQVVVECFEQRKVGKLPMVLAFTRLLQPQIQTPRDWRSDFKINLLLLRFSLLCGSVFTAKGWISHFGPVFFCKM